MAVLLEEGRSLSKKWYSVPSGTTTTNSTVRRILDRLKDTKTAGPNGIPPLVKRCVGELMQILCNIVSHLYCHGKFFQKYGKTCAFSQFINRENGHFQ